MSIHLIIGPMFCFEEGTEVMKYDKTICKIEQLKEEDLVMGDDMTCREIMDVCNGKSLLYTVRLSSGYEFKITENHILVLFDRITNKLVELTVLEYLDLSEVSDKNNGDYQIGQITNCGKIIYHNFTLIKSEIGNFYGIKVNGNQRFLLGGGYIVHNSGKTSELIRRCSKYNIGGKKCIVIKYAEDTRYSNEQVATHDGRTMEASCCTRLSDLENQCEDKDVVLIDEIQFYDDSYGFCERMASNGKMVIATGLNCDFRRQPFSEDMSKLISCADEIVHLTAVCVKCGEDASFTKRIIAGDEKKVIGGAEAYIATCRKCYFKND
jgi:thymidine kinase